MSSFIKLKHVQDIFATKNVDEMIIKKEKGIEDDGFKNAKL